MLMLELDTAPEYYWITDVDAVMKLQSYSSGLSQCFVMFFEASCEGLPGQ